MLFSFYIRKYFFVRFIKTETKKSEIKKTKSSEAQRPKPPIDLQEAYYAKVSSLK